jgi:hypothetical protein
MASIVDLTCRNQKLAARRIENLHVLASTGYQDFS